MWLRPWEEIQTERGAENADASTKTLEDIDGQGGTTKARSILPQDSVQFAESAVQQPSEANLTLHFDRGEKTKASKVLTS